jgi:hypothetical protein
MTGVLIAPIVSAQKLNGLWFKLKLAGKGEVVDVNTSNIVQKATFNIPVFAQFSNTVANTYTIRYWTQVDGVWTNSNLDTPSNIIAIGTNNTFLSDVGATFTGSGSNSVHVFHTIFIGTKLDSTGVVKSATYSGAGEIIMGTIVDSGVTNFFFGGCTINGATIDPSKFPF